MSHNVSNALITFWFSMQLQINVKINAPYKIVSNAFLTISFAQLATKVSYLILTIQLALNRISPIALKFIMQEQVLYNSSVCNANKISMYRKKLVLLKSNVF